MDTTPPFSKSADANKEAIALQLRKRCAPGAVVLEIASGTGQHAVYFSNYMQDVFWQPSDRDLDAYGLRETVASSARENLLPPMLVDVSRWPSWDRDYDAVYSANCIHVMPSELLERYVCGASQTLKPGGMMMLYGPFKYDGQFTTPSNEKFDAFLRGTYNDGGIRDFEEVDRLASQFGLEFHSDSSMPANNQFLIWRKKPA